ncbi:hypothetical protein BT69DRAFT_1333614 [Atractiella rhizophila]|nr:hypothetical protein BT69DRAFT_1333614 [Atractiella rhizophila]
MAAAEPIFSGSSPYHDLPPTSPFSLSFTQLSTSPPAINTSLAPAETAAPSTSAPIPQLNKGAYETRKLLLHLLDRLEGATGGRQVRVGIDVGVGSDVDMEKVVEMVGQLRELVLICTRMAWWVWDEEVRYVFPYLCV